MESTDGLRGGTCTSDPTNADAQFAKIESNAKKAASRYKRKCFWAPKEDMIQEAIAAQLKAATQFDPLKGRDYLSDSYDEADHFGAFTWKVAVKAIKRWLCKNSAPVSAQHRVDVLKGIRHEQISEAESIESSTNPEEDVHKIQSVDRTYLRVWEILSKEESSFALAVLTGEFEPVEIANYHDIDPSTVYKAIADVKRKLQRDITLFQIWKEA